MKWHENLHPTSPAPSRISHKLVKNSIPVPPGCSSVSVECILLITSQPVSCVAKHSLLLILPNPTPHRFRCSEGSISLSEQLRTYPSPDPTLTPTCYQLPDVGLGEEWVCSCTETDIDPFPLQLMTRAVREGGAWTWAIGTRKWCIVASCVNNTEIFFSCFVSKWHQYCLREEIDLH